MSVNDHHDVIVVGAGFGGLYAIHRLRDQGLDIVCLEADDDVGGVWLHNGYPGCRCDLPSVDYSYSFSDELQRDWQWSHRFSPQAEILSYLRHVADRFDLRRSIRFNTRVASVRRDDGDGLWHVETEAGAKLTARFVILASGNFSAEKQPEFPGVDDFRGELYRTSSWPRDKAVSFAGKRVAIFGTGASGVQAITEIAKTAGHLTVFQRSAAYTAPTSNPPWDKAESDRFKAGYADYRAKMRDDAVGAYMFTTGKAAAGMTAEERTAILDQWWEEGDAGYATAFIDILFNEEVNEFVADYVRRKMAERIPDPSLRAKLIPTDYPIGTRRPICDSGYLEIFSQDNVSLVDLRETPVVRVNASGIETSAGRQDFDMIVLAIGFDALTGSFTGINPVNGGGQSLRDHWRESPTTFMGMTVAGFPNLFLINGPGSAAASNVPLLIEATVDWIGDCIAWMDRRGVSALSPDQDAEDAWTAEVLAIGNASLFMKVPSWFTGGNIPGKARGILVYMGGLNAYVARAREVAAQGYKEFVTG